LADGDMRGNYNVYKTGLENIMAIGEFGVIKRGDKTVYGKKSTQNSKPLYKGHIAIHQTIFSTKVSKLIYFPSLIMPNCLITFIKIHN
jgi:hypothetical protein